VCVGACVCGQDLLTRHKRVVAQYLSEHYQPFFEAYNKLLRSSNYVTRRQSLKVCVGVGVCFGGVGRYALRACKQKFSKRQRAQQKGLGSCVCCVCFRVGEKQNIK